MTGTPQKRTFHGVSDIDWIFFEAPTDGTYQILVDVPYGSHADVDLVYYKECGELLSGQWFELFTPDVRLNVEATTGEKIYLKLTNVNIGQEAMSEAYHLSARLLANDEKAAGAVIIVAGQLKANDSVQDNIDNVAEAVYALFKSQGMEDDDIHVLAASPSLQGYDDSATAQNLREAITTWAVERVSPAQSLILYIVDHGDREQIYLDNLRGEVLTPNELNTWLSTLEETVPGVQSNIIIEACHSGSFIEIPHSISGDNRLVITSSQSEHDAYSSLDGAYFTDNLLINLKKGANLADSFNAAMHVVDELYPLQQPQLDVNGNGVSNEQEDVVLAASRPFLPSDLRIATETYLWPPFIADANHPPEIVDRRGRIHAHVRDDEGVADVWAVVYPPDYEPPETDGELNPEVQDIVSLQRIEGNDRDGHYYGDYLGFSALGEYRVVMYARDHTGLQTEPFVLTVDTNAYLTATPTIPAIAPVATAFPTPVPIPIPTVSQVFLPTVSR